MSPEIGVPGDPIALARNGIRMPVAVGPARSGKYPHRLSALIDTGAPLTYYIDAGLAKKLELRPVSGPMIQTRSLASTDRYPQFLAGIRLDQLGLQVPLARLVGFDIKRIDATLDLIIGRGFLQGCKMIYNGKSGSVQLSR